MKNSIKNITLLSIFFGTFSFLKAGICSSSTKNSDTTDNKNVATKKIRETNKSENPNKENLNGEVPDVNFEEVADNKVNDVSKSINIKKDDLFDTGNNKVQNIIYPKYIIKCIEHNEKSYTNMMLNINIDARVLDNTLSLGRMIAIILNFKEKAYNRFQNPSDALAIIIALNELSAEDLAEYYSLEKMSTEKGFINKRAAKDEEIFNKIKEIMSKMNKSTWQKYVKNMAPYSMTIFNNGKWDSVMDIKNITDYMETHKPGFVTDAINSLDDKKSFLKVYSTQEINIVDMPGVVLDFNYNSEKNGKELYKQAVKEDKNNMEFMNGTLIQR